MQFTYGAMINQRRNINIDVLGNYLPGSLVENYKKRYPGKFRDRVYGLRDVLNGIMLQTVETDKSEEHVVHLLWEHHEQQKRLIEEQESIFRDKQPDQTKRKPGRPRKQFVHVQKSKRQSISTNTASFDEAKARFPKDLLLEAFRCTTTKEIHGIDKEARKWYGHEVKIVDATLIETVDNVCLRKEYAPKQQKNPLTLPLARVVGIIDYYGGYIQEFAIGGYYTSETALLSQIHDKLSPGSLILADELYGRFPHFAYCLNHGIELISQVKINRKEIIEKQLGENDYLIRWKRTKNTKVVLWKQTDQQASIQLRKISIPNPRYPDKWLQFYTTLTDAGKYPAAAIVALYLCRWDIELSFREIKQVMKLTNTRGKSVDSVEKEIISHLLVYNILRTQMQSVFAQQGEDFFSLRTSFYQDDENSKNDTSYVDRLGRTYARKSPGRYPNLAIQSQEEENHR